MTEPQIALWHPMVQEETEADLDSVARYVALLGPFMQTYPGLTVDDYWQLSVSEHGAMLEWLYATEVVDRPEA